MAGVVADRPGAGGSGYKKLQKCQLWRTLRLQSFDTNLPAHATLRDSHRISKTGCDFGTPLHPGRKHNAKNRI
ncbi:hypothetical protein [Roseovarius sp. M141]|uniref:hypothetical protein n=1 Tax=Roseovarius sp. M141 TaxID=2583806 RepID=UPI0020CD9409|nr:hypothetical protein [Roseovarius sp. M141]MCQ0091864.1 hypothetical protein [Roseovarius sp. M141]